MKAFWLLFLLSGCAGIDNSVLSDFEYKPIQTPEYEIATWQKITNPQNKNVHIYIEGDGHAYNAYGRPTSDPTPRGTFLRDLAQKDTFDNVVYMARPCQFIMDKNCTESDWTTGRFAQKIINSESEAIKQIAKNKHITLIGYSGGAMVSGLVIKQHPEFKIDKWITVAGVLNHHKWTQYFGDMALSESLNMESLPNIKQKHFIGGKDKTIPYNLAKQWANQQDIILIENATHDNFGKIDLFK